MEVFRWSSSSAEQRRALFARPSESSNAYDVAREILLAVETRGDDAVFEYARTLDNWAPNNGFRVSIEEMRACADELAPENRDAILAAADAVRAYHKKQGYQPFCEETWPGAKAERWVRPIEIAGLYVPAGTAPLVSTLIMLAVPAQIAGVERIALIAPPRKGEGVEPTLLAAAHLLGIEELYAIGGAHGIAALGYGVAGLPKADKIFGPGNAYVAAAKALLAQSDANVATDLPAGPSEVMVVADGTASADLVAIDLLSQAEHDPLAQVVLVAYSEAIVTQVKSELDRLIQSLPRKDIAKASIANARAVIVSNDDEAVEACNAYASEHLIIQTDNPRNLAQRVKHAGSVFLGRWSPEAAGDYAAGPNHALPTAGAARAYGGVTVEMFQKTMSVLELGKDSVAHIAPVVERLADLEGLEAHRLAMAMRREKVEQP